MSTESDPTIAQQLEEQQDPISYDHWVQFCYAMWLHMRQPTLTVLETKGTLKQDKLRDLKLKPPPEETIGELQLKQLPSIAIFNGIVKSIRSFLLGVDKRTYWDHTTKELMMRASKAIAVTPSLEPMDEQLECAICRDMETRDRIPIYFQFADTLFPRSAVYVVCSHHFYMLLAYVTVNRLGSHVQALLLGPNLKAVSPDENFTLRFAGQQLQTERDKVNLMLKYIHKCTPQ